MNAVRATKVRPFRRAALKLYHGGVPGLVPGQMLEPPALRGVPSCSDHGSPHCRSDRVYLTNDPEEAAVYAALAPRGGRGDVFGVQPCGDLEPEAPGETGAGSYAVPAATVAAVERHAIRREDAVAQMTAFFRKRGIEHGAVRGGTERVRAGANERYEGQHVDDEERTELK